MPRGLEIVLTLVGVLLIVLLVRSSLLASRGSRWSLGQVAGFAAVVLPNATTAVAAFTGTRIATTNTFYQPVIYFTGAAEQVNRVASPTLATLFIIVGLVSAIRHHRINPAPLLYLIVLIIGAIGGAEAGFPLITTARLTMVAVIASLIFIPPGKAVLAGAAYGLALLAGLSLVGAALHPTAFFGACGSRKCGAFGILYTGVADNSNAFGLLMALAVPVVYFGLGRNRWLFTIVATSLALASGSRTAQIAALIGVLLVAVAGQRRSPGRRRFAATTALLAAASVIALPLLNLPDSAFTGRAYLWRMALSEFRRQPLTGYGADYWASNVTNQVIAGAAGYATHNQLTETLLVSGVLGLLATLGVVAAVVANNRADGTVLAIVATSVLICGTLERPWSLGGVDWMAWSIFVTLSLSPGPSVVAFHEPGELLHRSAVAEAAA